jgi:hypothetical protein
MTATTAPSRRRHKRGKSNIPSLIVIGFCGGAILLATILTPTTPDTPLEFMGVPLPPTCSSVRDFGIECPGCGLTRSWVSAVHGRLAESWSHHRIGWLVLLYAMAQTLRHICILAKPDWRPHIESRLGKTLDRGIIVVAALLFLNWLPYLWHEILRPMW